MLYNYQYVWPGTVLQPALTGLRTISSWKTSHHWRCNTAQEVVEELFFFSVVYGPTNGHRFEQQTKLQRAERLASSTPYLFRPTSTLGHETFDFFSLIFHHMAAIRLRKASRNQYLCNSFETTVLCVYLCSTHNKWVSTWLFLFSFNVIHISMVPLTFCNNNTVRFLLRIVNSAQGQQQNSHKP